MRRRKVAFNLGDLVRISYQNRVGIVKADDKAWYVIKGHFCIAGCIVKPSEVVKVIKRGAVPKRYLRFLYG